jgi:putative two-component system response regulator
MTNSYGLHEAPILIVDNEPENTSLLADILKDAGYRNVITATDAREVVGLYALHRPGVILLDIQMPHIDGFELMSQMRLLDPGGFPPVLVLTGAMDRDLKLKALSSGAKDFLTRPVDPAEVIARTKNLLEIGMFHQEMRNQNRILEEKVRERTRELQESQIEVVYRLARACERRDQETGDHIMRMSLYSTCLARGLGLPPEECDLIRHASPMHDIGKIAIPDSILLKVGPLTEDEWAIMRVHAEIGAEMLADGTSDLVKAGQVIALTHHERWDGTGYPCARAGEDIPLYGRICAMADVFDALTSKRVYKAAWPVKRAVDEMHRKKGNHFDPALVDAFDRMLPEILAIRDENELAALGGAAA